MACGRGFRAPLRATSTAKSAPHSFALPTHRSYSSLLMKRPIISCSPDVMGGTPVFAGTRVPVQTVLEYLEAGPSIGICRSSRTSQAFPIAIFVLRARTNRLADLRPLVPASLPLSPPRSLGRAIHRRLRKPARTPTEAQGRSPSSNLPSQAKIIDLDMQNACKDTAEKFAALDLNWWTCIPEEVIGPDLQEMRNIHLRLKPTPWIVSDWGRGGPVKSCQRGYER